MNGLVRNCAAVMYDGIRGLSMYMPHCTADMVGKSDSLSGHKCHVRSAMEKKNRPVDRRGADSVERFHPVGFQQCQDIFLLVQ